jgi:serine/threonine protein phosphatase PrpC
MLRIAEHWHGSDLGRQRQGNEDNFFVRSPLFVVADGMGGAQAGEVASEMAVKSFEPGLGDGAPAESLVRVIEGANRRIHDRSRSDEQRAGMGTTVTAAYVGESEVVVAHVGDSRAYLWRNGDLIRLTKDHSLVGELVARGKLTEEQAEAHPQRSVITRALGPEPNVQVDVDVFTAGAGDVFLLCSDGLTSMVNEAKLKPILAGAESLEQAGRALIAAANEAGGRDNITVILFRLEEVGSRTDGASERAEEPDTSEYATFSGEALGGPRQGASRPYPQVTDEVEAEYRRTGTVALPAIRPRAETETESPPPPPRTAPPPPQRTAPLPEGARPQTAKPGRRRRRRRISAGPILALLLALCVLGGLWVASRAVYFVGTDPSDGRTVAIFRGLPYDLPLGIHLYERYAGSGVTVDMVAPSRRATFTDHKLRSKDDAENLVNALERGQLSR